MILTWVSVCTFINIMNKDGSLNENAGPFKGKIALLPARMGATTGRMEFW